jgi:hypothetical protein
MLMEQLAKQLPETAIVSVGHRPELEAFHERKVNLMRREGGARLVPGEVTAPPINLFSGLMKRWRVPSAASPATPTAASNDAPRPPRKAA